MRFDPHDADEIELRVLLPHAHELRVPHVAFLGDQEKIFQETAAKVQARARAAGRSFETVVVPGGHMEALAPALEGYLQMIHADASEDVEEEKGDTAEPPS